MVKFEPVFKVRIVYKSGYTHDFECTKFSFSGTKASWEFVSDENKPVHLGLDDIAAIWQVGVRHRIKWK